MNLRLAVIVLSIAVLSCSMIEGLGGAKEAEKVRKLNESIPASMPHADEDLGANDPSNFKIILPVKGQMLLGNPESEPIDQATLVSKIQEFTGAKTPDKKFVYIAAAVDIPSSEVAVVIDELRRQGVEIVKLVVSGRDPNVDEGGWLTKPVKRPDRVFELRISPTELFIEEGRPNPLTLFVTNGTGGRPILNNEPQADLEALSTRLNEVFKERERNGVRRVNSNETEKTVLVKHSKDDIDQRYGDLVKLIDALKGSGASPIILSEGLPIPTPINFPEDVMPPRPSVNEIPKSISGGVLNGQALSLPKPPYPPAARAVNAKGAVNVQITVDVDGKVIRADAVSGHSLLRPAAVAAARNAKFAPKLLSGKPVKVNGILVYNFAP